MLNCAFSLFPSLIAAVAMSAPAQTSGDIVNQTFKDGDGGWMGMGANAKLSVTHDPGIALPAAGALKVDYNVAKNDLAAAVLPTGLDSWTKAKSLKFRIRSDSDTIFAVNLQEQDGGRYTSMIRTQKDTWQAVELSTADFILAQDKTDPKDPDGKLDMDRVTGFGVVDVAEFMVSLDNPMLQSLFNVKPGAHTFYIDSFTVSTEPISAESSSVGDTVQLETLSHPQLSWISLGGVNLVKTNGKSLTGPCLRADYHQTPGKPALLNRPLQQWILTGAKMLSFDIASAQPARLIVQIEQYDGGKYNMTVDVPGGSAPQHEKLLLSGFIRSDDSSDTDTKPHLAAVKSIAFIDVTGMMDQTDHDNTLWLNHLVATSAAD